MISGKQANRLLFLLMFLTFVFLARISDWLGFKTAGLEYLAWFGLMLIVILLNFVALRSKLFISAPYLLTLFILLGFCALNFIFVDVPGLRYVQGTFFSFLFVFNFVVFYNVRLSKDDFYSIARTIVMVITSLGIAIYLERLLVPGTYQVFALRGVITLAKDPSFAATLLNANIALCLALYMNTRKRIYLVIVFGSIVTISLLLFLKALAGALLICLVFVNIHYRARVSKMVLWGLAGVFFVLLIFADPILQDLKAKGAMYFGSGYEKIPRNALYLGSFKIAKDYFPFGSGQGTFGSYPVGKEYSDIYYAYKLNDLHGLGPEDAMGETDSNFIFDTYWSMIIGEMGFIAAALYLLLWFYPSLRALRFLRESDLALKGIAFVIVMITVDIFIESVAAPIPGQLQFILLY